MTFPSSAPESARHQKLLQKRMQPGTILSTTTVHHPPSGFPNEPRTIGLIELEDGTRVTGLLLAPADATIAIGSTVMPRMRLLRVNEQGLRIYDVAYELSVAAPIKKQEFQGYILAITGPSGVGKSTVSKLVTTQISEHVTKVPILTTRAPKDGDDGEYIHITPEEFAELKKEGKLAAATRIPSQSEKRWYGYRASDIEAIWKEKKIPIVITEMHLLQGLASHFGRRSILSFGLLPPGRSKRQMLSALLHRLRSRGRDSEKQITERMKNAEIDLAFFAKKKELFNKVLVNDDLDAVFGTLQAEVLEAVKT